MAQKSKAESTIKPRSKSQQKSQSTTQASMDAESNFSLTSQDSTVGNQSEDSYEVFELGELRDIVVNKINSTHGVSNLTIQNIAQPQIHNQTTDPSSFQQIFAENNQSIEKNAAIINSNQDYLESKLNEKPLQSAYKN